MYPKVLVGTPSAIAVGFQTIEKKRDFAGREVIGNFGNIESEGFLVASRVSYAERSRGESNDSRQGYQSLL